MTRGASIECRGGTRRDPETIRRDGWQTLGILVVPLDDPRLAWPERESLQQIGKKLYGPRKEEGEAK